MERAPFSVEWLAQARIDRNWTQEYVAERMEVEIKTVRRWEQGLHQPHIRQYQRLCQLFDKKQAQDSPPPLLDQETATVQHMEGRQTFHPAALHETDDTYTRFQARNRTLRLLRLVLTWPPQGGTARYQALQTLVMQEMEREDNNTMHENSISRRNALRYLASLPIELHGLSLLAPTLSKPYPYEEVLTQCAGGITACWYLRKGKDLAFASDVISRYIPTLQGIVETGTKAQRKSAAELLVQCLLLRSTLSWLLGANNAASYAQSAEKYATVAGNTLLQVVALRTQAAAYSYANHWDLALNTAEKAGYLLEAERDEPISQLVQSYVYAGLATYQSYYKQRKQDAFASLEKAYASFHDAQATHEVLPVWIDHNQANLVLNDGMMHYHLGLYEQARNSFAQTKKIQQDDVGRVEILIDEVIVELERDDQPRDMDWCIATWQQGIEQAKTLRSEQWFNEAVAVYRTMRAAWPGEQRIKKLREQIIHW